jgi:transcriptional regulator with XRE-family HTH domain
VIFAKKNADRVAHLARMRRAGQATGPWQFFDVSRHTLSRRRLDHPTFQALQTLLASGGLHVSDELASAIRSRRTHEGLTASALADKAGTSLGQVEAIERGGVDLSPSELVRMAGALNVDLVWFIENEPTALAGRKRGGPFDLDGDLADAREGLELMHAFASIADPKARRAVLELALKFARHDVPDEG